MNRDEIYKKVQGVLVDALGVDEEEVTPDAVIKDDLGLQTGVKSRSEMSTSGGSTDETRPWS